MPKYDASTAECLLFTEKAGLLASVAHDLKLLVTRFEVELDHRVVRARFDAASVRVVCARRDGRDAPGLLSAGDRAEIEKNIVRTVLECARYPVISFHSTACSRCTAASSPSPCSRTGQVALIDADHPMLR